MDEIGTQQAYWRQGRLDKKDTGSVSLKGLSASGFLPFSSVLVSSPHDVRSSAPPVLLPRCPALHPADHGLKLP